MHIIHIDNITVNLAGHEIFRDLSWVIGDRDRVGLIGPNGAGKSTLLKALLGEVVPDSGHIVRQRGITLGYLPQAIDLTPGHTLIQEAMTLPPALAAVEAELTRIEEKLADPAVYNDEKKLMRVLAQQEKVLEQYERLGGPSHESQVRSLLAAFGFRPQDDSLPAETLSGGEKKLIMLARLSIEQPDVLLLDEPDNHLDLAAKRALEGFIRNYNGAVIIVSHDRYLLDETVTHIAELDRGRLTLYVGSYSAYATEKELRELRQQQMYAAQQKEIAHIEEAIARFALWAKIYDNEKMARKARSHQKRLDRMEANGEIIDKVAERRTMDLQLNGGRGSKQALMLESVAMGFNDDLLFLDLDLLVRHGERVGLIGPNGVGKSVLFRLILGQLAPLDGRIRIGPSTQVGYYSQEHQRLSTWLDRTPLELVRDVTPMTEGNAVTFLTKFLFNYDQTRQPIRTMSGGERSRLQMACLMLEQPNLLLLDEPTNNLDIPSCEVLEGVLNDFDGAIFVISHDRYFLDQVVDRVVELQDGTLAQFLGGYSDYLKASGRLV